MYLEGLKWKDSFPKKLRVSTGDIETWDGLRGTKFRMGAIRWNGKRTYVFERLEGFIDFILERLNGHILYFHNLDFDGRFILEELKERRNTLPEFSTHIVYSHGLRQIRINYRRKSGGMYDLIIRDSLALLLVSQEKLEMLFLGRKVKHDIDWKMEVSDEDIRIRVSNDVESLHDVIMTFASMVLEDFGVNVFSCLTLPSVGLKVFRTCYMDQPMYNPFYSVDGNERKPNALYDLIRKGLRGGRTEVLAHAVNREEFSRFSVYDINSLYPFVSVNYDFPLGSYSVREYSGNVPEGEGFFAGIVDEPYSFLPVLPVSHNSRTYYPYGRKVGVYPLNILRYAMDTTGTRIVKGWFIMASETGRPFREMMLDLYRRRRSSDNPSHSFIYKILMNSTLGKTAQRSRIEHYQVISDMDSFLEDEGNDSTSFMLSDDGTGLMKSHSEEFRMYMFPSIFAYITAYGQIELHKVLWNMDKAFYCDTDSIHGILSEGQEIPLGDELGEWKPEPENVVEAYYVSPKVYYIRYEDEDGIIRSKVSAKGFPKARMRFDNSGKTKPIPISEFLDIIGGDSSEKYNKMLSSVKRHHTYLSWDRKPRKLRQEEVRREFLEDGYSRPLENPRIDLIDEDFREISELIAELIK